MVSISVYVLTSTSSLFTTSAKPVLFFANSGLEEVEVPDSIKFIGDGAFSGCNNLKEAVVKSSCDTLPNSAFANCKHLTDICLDESGINNIEAYAFKDCWLLENLKFPNALMTMDATAVEGCYNLGKINIPENVVEISNPYCLSFLDAIEID